MVRRSAQWLRLGEWVLNRRWWLVAMGSLGIFAFEFVEYHPSPKDVSLSFFFEIAFYGILLPVLTGLVLTTLKKLTEARSELAWSLYYGDLKHNLNTQLNNTHSKVELAETFLQFVKVIVPLAGIELYYYERDNQNFQPILRWSQDKQHNRFTSPPRFTIENCLLPLEDPGVDAIALWPCTGTQVNVASEASSCYCIPFYFSNTLIAGARLHLLSGSTLTLEQIRLLKEVAPDVASAFQRIQLEFLAKKRDNTGVSVEQQRIARDVHDTLGHSLAYLRLRLDQISMEINPSERNNLKQEVENLRDVAKEAYHQMRNVLIMLSPDKNSNINASMETFATKIKQRANFELRFQSNGQSHHLPFSVQRNIYYIFQEMLTNIEKHAHAKTVNVDLNWEESCLLIDVCDDGVGFDINLAKYGHFGLRNMQERALECNALFTITSQAGQGTRLELQVPYGGNT